MPISWSLSWIVTRGKMAQITRKCTRWKCKRMPPNLSLSSMLKEKPKRTTSSVSGRVGKLHHVSRFCHQLARRKVFLSVDRIVLLFCYRKLPRGCACGLQYDFDGAVTMDGHVLRTELCCINGYRVKWASSSILGSKYTANCRWNKIYF